jgi:predicted CoA-binding protein
MNMPKQTVAVLGASADRSKFSNKAVRAFLQKGWQVFPINPKGGQIEGLESYPSLDQVPVRLDCVTLYLPPSIGIKMLPAVAKAAPEEFYVNPGAESDELIAQARQLGLNPIQACSIIEIGSSPAMFGD